MAKTIVEEIIDSICDPAFWKQFETSHYNHQISNSTHYHDAEQNQEVILIQAAGFKREDIDIQVNNKGIVLKGKIQDSLKDQLSRNEFHCIYHKDDVDADSVNASLENGILKVTFKTLEQKTSKKININ